MDALPVSASLQEYTVRDDRNNLVRLFRTIPPERVGLNGEYDHSGLAKRVTLAFSQNFRVEEIRQIRITQRGAVVVLVGQVPSQRLLNELVRVALNVYGAADVEVNGVSVVSPHMTYLKLASPIAALSAMF
jgi:hypothetical protein